MKLIKIGLIILGGVSLIYLGACRNPFKFNKHERDKTNFTPTPKNGETDKDKIKHTEGGGSKQKKPVRTLIASNSRSIAS
ncbi:hypothetical protein [Chamaesiphon polymorphus]|uniref:Uncharacterized protein n=1 Tax=Chamaesiphon polymorphus CCALA 037 TaxID=2107692 RepID=A0A2T1GGY1_9CYAN|nr:hypothetical protein [Chamaesiphon polymorphus]PSB56927.1 hypothetical protein C7B77_10135 [Chamaesiphon polymorphus CCALA 037]